MRPRTELRPVDVTAIIDTREQLPLCLDPLRFRRQNLSTGDYSVAGLEGYIAVERKGLQDLVMCVGRERERFEREIQRLKAYEVRAIVVEAAEASVELRQYRGEVHPNAVLGSVMAWRAEGVPVYFCADRDRAQRFVSRLLFVAARKYWRVAQNFIPTLKIIGGTHGESESSLPIGAAGQGPGVA